MRILKELVTIFFIWIIRNRWSNRDLIKILIFENNYFTRERWEKKIAENSINKQNWDIVYCRNKFTLLKHFQKADICFLLGYNNFYNRYGTHNKLLYFPIIGLDFIEKREFPSKFKIIAPPPYSAEAIAEYCLAMTINIVRNFHHSFFSQKDKKWNQKSILKQDFSSISKNKIGIMGVGKVGKQIAKILKQNNFRVLGLNKEIDKKNMHIDYWYELKDFTNFLKETDILIIALPLNSETKGIIGINELKTLGKDSYLINISRGNIISEDDLILALKTKQIKGAVLDVFSREPLSSKSRLYKLENVILTPHIAGNINLFVDRIQDDFLQNIIEIENYAN